MPVIANDEYLLTKFTEQERCLWRQLRTGQSRSINKLISMSCFAVSRQGMPPRYQQQYIGAHISRINAKLPRGYRIEPGVPRHTYQLKVVP
jgi:hypothetical protein